MEHKQLIYLDNAATTFPKPASVAEEMWRCLTQYGGNPGRGAHALSMAAAEKIFECRALAAELFGMTDPERVFFTLNTTHGLNTVLKGLLETGDHVLISDMEHNAVYRPISKLAKEGKITFDIFETMTGDPRRNAVRICAKIARKLKPNTRMIVCNHVSNICSATLPLREIASFCRRHGLLLVVDGAQSAGHERIPVDEWGISALCVPGHKGLYGPQGSGMVMLGRGITLNTLTEGGNGIHSLEWEMPDFSPERYEAGTLPTPALAGLCEGLRTVKNIGEETILTHEKTLYRRAREILGNLPEIRLIVPEYEGATLLFTMKGISTEELGARLNEDGICVRSGYHCSALGHKTLGTEDGGGVRISFGMYNRLSELDGLYRSLMRIRKDLL